MNAGFDSKSRWVRPATMAVGAVTTALALQMALHTSLGYGAPLLLLVISVGVVAWHYGARAGLAATALAGLAASFFLLPPFYSFRIDAPGDRIQVLLFMVEGVALSLLCEANRQARKEQRLMAARERTALARVGELAHAAAEQRQEATSDAADWRQIAQVLAAELEDRQDGLAEGLAEYARACEIAETGQPVPMAALLNRSAAAHGLVVRSADLPAVNASGAAMTMFLNAVMESAGMSGATEISVTVGRRPDAWIFMLSGNAEVSSRRVDGRTLIRIATCRKLMEGERGRLIETAMIAGGSVCIFSLPRG